MKWDDFWEDCRHSQWDYRNDGSKSGQENMDLDLQLLQEIQKPTLRLYTWDRPTLTLGRNQREDWIDVDLCHGLGVDIVRRPTGGRALLHMDDEITYAVILPQVEGLSVREAFEGIAAQLAKTLRHLGIDVSSATSSNAPTSSINPYCGEVLAAGEVCWQGHKLIGSAQMRSQERLLQHGSLLRYGNGELLNKVIPGSHPRLALADIGWENLQAEDIIIAWEEMLKS